MTVHEDLIVFPVDAGDLGKPLVNEEGFHAVTGDVGEGRSKGFQIAKRREFVHQEQALMLVNRFHSPIVIRTNDFRMAAHHHFEEQAEDRGKTKQVRRRRNEVKRDRQAVIHQIIDAEIRTGSVLGKHRIQIFFQGCIRRRNDGSQFVFRF